MAQLLLASSSLTAAAPASLAEALARVEARLDDWASNSTAYNSLLEQAFAGAGTDLGLWQQAAAALAGTLQSNGLAISLELLGNAELPGINGAYAVQAPGGGERIYLNATWLQAASTTQIEAVLLEELGHAIDRRLNGSADSPGDEGERFSALIRGLEPPAASFTENDQRQIVVGGVTVSIEADTTAPVARTTAPAFAAETASSFGLADVGAFANPSFVDIDGDGDLDAFIGNRDGNTLFFRNTAAPGATSPAFAVAITNPFGITDVGFSATPAFIDIDRDGDLDAFIGNNLGSTLFFRNTATPGATTPAFAAETTSFGLPDVGFCANPSFVDIDRDGDLDAFIGNSTGSTLFFRNTAAPGASAPAFAAETTTSLGLTDVGNSASPTFVDIDGDGDLDAFIGNDYGNTLFFRNIAAPGANTPAFAAASTGSFGLKDVGDSANPSFVDIDGDGDLDVFIGNDVGSTLFFRNTAPVLGVSSSNVNGSYGIGAVLTLSVRFSEAVTATGLPGVPRLQLETGSTDRFATFTGGSGTNTLTFSYTVQAGDTSADLDVLSSAALSAGAGVTIKDPFFGNIANLTLAAPGSPGSLAARKNLVIDGTVPVALPATPGFGAETTTSFGLADVGAFASPSFVDIDGDGDLDAFIGEQLGSLRFFRNTATPGASTPAFAAETTSFGLADVGYSSSPSFADIDGDGDLDAFIGNRDGSTLFFRNTATPGASTPAFAAETTTSFGLADVGSYASPNLVDIDGDGDLDAFIGDNAGNTLFFRNTATPGASSPAFVANTTTNFGLADVGLSASPSFIDIDSDGDLDAFIGNRDGITFFFRNTATPGASSPAFAAETTTSFGLADVGTSASPSFVDIDGDGDLDAFIGNNLGSTLFFRNTAPMLGVSSINANGIYSIGAVLTLTLRFSEAVIVTGVPRLQLETGSTDRFATFTGGSGTNTLTFSYTVQAGDTSADLDVLSSAAISFGGGTIQDAASNIAVLTLAAPGSLGSLAARKDLVIDTTPPAALTTAPAFVSETTSFALTDVGTSASPSFVDIDGDGDLDAFIGNDAGNTLFFRNIAAPGASVPAFAAETTTSLGLTDVGNDASPTFVDIDGDGDLDAFIGNSYGIILFFRNIAAPGASVPAFAAETTTSLGLTDVGNDASPTFVDIDGDGDLDAFIGNDAGNTLFFRNTTAPGASAPAFAAETISSFGIADVSFVASPTFADIDGDSDLDAFIGNDAGNTLFFRNIAAPGASVPAFAAETTTSLGLTDVGNNASPTFVDIDGDGDLDAFIGNDAGNTLFFRNNAPVLGVSSTTTNGSYGTAGVIILTLRFSEAVVVNTSGGSPTLLLETGTVDRDATFSGAAGNTLTFSYTVQAGDSSPDLDLRSINALQLNGATIRDSAGNNAVLTLAAPGSPASLAARKALVIDGIAPLITAGPTAATAPAINGFTLTANEAATAALRRADNSLLFPTALAANTSTLLTVAAQAAITATSLDVTDLAGNRTTSTTSVLLGTNNSDALNGTANADVIFGFGGNDTLTGAAGTDQLVGGDGSDSYSLETVGDLVVETNADAATGGTDTVLSSLAAYTLMANVENLTLMGAAVSGTGNTLNNLITGNTGANSLNGDTGADTLDGGEGADTLNGGSGTDTLIGRSGNDIYIIDASGDSVVELNPDPITGGVDSVLSSLAAYTLTANVENLTLTGAAAINGTGNTLNNVITGNAATNSLDGGAGADTLNGAAGIDTLTGGDGNDTYMIETAGDLVVETNAVAATGGIDTVLSSLASYTLTANVENLTLTGAAAINGTGNTLNNLITGNTAANSLTGDAGNDTLNGGAGIDTLTGGAGSDTYSIETVGDLVLEFNPDPITGGVDTVLSSLAAYTLTANVENLTLIGAAISGTGNTLNNLITGNTAANSLSGEAGADTLDGGDGVDTLNGGTGSDSLIGRAGNDTYIIDSSGDSVVEFNPDPLSGGVDTVLSSLASYTLAANVENLTLTGAAAINGTGNTLNNVITGNTAANVLSGAAGNDTLAGGAGNDTLTGGLNADVFRFDSPLNATTNRDLITDFSLAEVDWIQLENSVFTTLTTTGTLAASAFRSGAAATSADHRILFDSATGLLSFDSDGTGAAAAIAFATLTPGLGLSSSQFTVT
jgi:Ca2+-binding RTX toxin-like protein